MLHDISHLDQAELREHRPLEDRLLVYATLFWLCQEGEQVHESSPYSASESRF